MKNAATAYLFRHKGVGQYCAYFFNLADQLIGVRTYNCDDLSNSIFRHIAESVTVAPLPPPPPPPPLYPPPSKNYFEEVGPQTQSPIASIIGLADPATVGKLHDKYRVSPDGKYRVGTRYYEGDSGGEWDWIEDAKGKKVTSEHTDLGSFIGWTPDSKYAMFEGVTFLGVDDKATSSGVGGFGASVSPRDGSIVYSDECCGTNDSELRIKRSAGE